jgi:hypothetical protein
VLSSPALGLQSCTSHTIAHCRLHVTLAKRSFLVGNATVVVLDMSKPVCMQLHPPLNQHVLLCTCVLPCRGVPAGIATREQDFDKMQPGTMGGTYGGNAVACAAAVATIQVSP